MILRIAVTGLPKSCLSLLQKNYSFWHGNQQINWVNIRNTCKHLTNSFEAAIVWTEENFSGCLKSSIYSASLKIIIRANSVYLDCYYWKRFDIKIFKAFKWNGKLLRFQKWDGDFLCFYNFCLKPVFMCKLFWLETIHRY